MPKHGKYQNPQIPKWKVNRVIQLYFNEHLPHGVIKQRTGISDSTYYRIIHAHEEFLNANNYEGDHQ